MGKISIRSDFGTEGNEGPNDFRVWLAFVADFLDLPQKRQLKPRIPRMGTDNQSIPKERAVTLAVTMKRWARAGEVSGSVVSV
jgi:hypothetical protein